MADNRLTADNGDSFPKTVEFNHHGKETTFQWVNGLDVTATFTLNGTYSGDSSFTDAVELVSTDVTSGSTDRDSLSEEWDKLQIEIDATSPTSGQADAYQHDPKRRTQ